MTAPTIYNYDATTHELLGMMLARPDPAALDAARQTAYNAIALPAAAARDAELAAIATHDAEITAELASLPGTSTDRYRELLVERANLDADRAMAGIDYQRGLADAGAARDAVEPAAWLTPANATRTAPAPELPADHVQVYDPTADSWSPVIDYRGRTVWDTVSRAHSLVTTLGPLQLGVTLLEPGTAQVWINGAWVDDPAEQRALYAAHVRTAVQGWLDAAAKARGYDSIATAVTYADEPAVAAYQAEGAAFRAWRSTVWAAVFDSLAAEPDGALDTPAATILAGLPQLVI